MKIQKYISIALTGLALSLSNASFADVDTLAKNLKNNYPNLSEKDQQQLAYKTMEDQAQ